MGEELDRKVVALLNDLEAFRKVLRLYPPGHPGLSPAEGRLRRDLRELAGEPLVRLVLNPDRVFWGEQEVVPPPEAPGRKLVQTLFQLGIAVVQLTFPEAEEGLLLLAQELSSQAETPREEDRQRLLEKAFPGLQLFPLDLSGVQLVAEEEISEKDGRRLVWPELARILARDGAFSWPGKLKEGLLDAGSVLELANQVADPGALFEYLFRSVAEVLQQTPQAQRPLLVSELRLFLADLCRLASAEHRARAVAAFVRQPTLAALLSAQDPMAPWEALLDGVELLLLEGEPVPEAVQRLVFHLASPEAARELGLPPELVARARALLSRLPLPGQEPPAWQEGASPVAVRWDGEPWARELAAALGEGEVRGHLVRVLGEMLTLSPGTEAGEAAAARLVELFCEAVETGEYATAQRLAPVVGSSRNVLLQEKALQEAVGSVVAALATADRQYHATLEGLLAGLGERALPAILEELANAESLAVRKRLLETVLRYGQRAVPYVRQLLEDDRWYVVRNAVFLLRRLGDRAIAPAIKRLLPQARPQVVGEILKALVAFEDPEWFSLLRKELASGDEERLRVAVAVASRIPHPGVVRALMERLRQQMGMKLREPITLELIRALGRLRDPRALPLFREILELKQWRYPFALAPLRREAAFAVAQLPGQEAQELARALEAGKDSELAEAVRQARAASFAPEEEA
jgi:HEAT repeat protein